MFGKNNRSAEAESSAEEVLKTAGAEPEQTGNAAEASESDVPDAEAMKETESGPLPQPGIGPDQEAGPAGNPAHKNGIFLTGLAVTVLGIAALWSGVWLFGKTRGVRLLFTSVLIGRAAKYYWIALIIGAILLCVGIVLLRRTLRMWLAGAAARKEARQAAKEKKKAGRAQPMAESDRKMAESEREKTKMAPPVSAAAKSTPAAEPAARYCPECGRPVTPGTKFCGGCGRRLE